ncbi:MAG TPA: RNA methyltransferase, partial [Phycisphaerales bacterium]|nr:RNA methyltransferase [Phycisphaerales bacterium]
ATVDPWPAGLGAIAAEGFEPLAMTPARDAVDINGLCLCGDRRPLILLGTEGRGVASETLDTVHRLGGRAVRIDMEPEADSLNVAVACAVVLHRLRSAAGRTPPG